MYTHNGSLVAPILAAVILASAELTQAAPILDSEFNTDIQHRVWAVRDPALQRADNPSVPESVLLQLYRHATTLDQVAGPVDRAEDAIMESDSFRALAEPTTALGEPALVTALGEPAPFALLAAALGGLFFRRRK
jgi:hypothetical protein